MLKKTIIHYLDKASAMINLRMSSFTYGPILTQPGFPASYKDSRISGSEQVYAEGTYGVIFLQSIPAGSITFLYTIFKLKEDMALDFQCAPQTIQVHAAMKNDSLFHIMGIGDLHFCEGQFNLLDSVRLDGSYYLEKDNEYRTLHIDFSSTFLDKLLPAMPYLEAWIASGNEISRVLFQSNGWLSLQQRELLNQVLYNPYSGSMQTVYREIKAMEFMLLLLSQDTIDVTPAMHLTRRHINAIEQSRIIMDEAFDQHLNIATLSEQTGMTEFKLKAGFRKIFGISIFEYFLQTRMRVARDLLLQTDKPIKEIALLTGYSSKQSFLHAFKKFYHDTPGSYRRNQQER